MGKTDRLIAGGLIVVALIALVVLYLHGHTVAVFDPAGVIANRERRLIFITLGLSLVVVIPVFAMLIGFTWKYREGRGQEYKPDWDGSRTAETVWWLVPTLLISILAVITWQSTHELDPFKPIASTQKPLTVQVVAMEWKWLFIYPDQKAASVNELHIPVNRPVNFQITADAPMNSLWIPQLGGQIYAMAGMSTQLHLMADKPGSYRGSSANLSGSGFSGMHFQALATSQQDFNAWANQAKQSNNKLTSATYNDLAKASREPVTYLSAPEDKLYNKVMLKFMVPDHQQLNPDEDPDSVMHMEHNQ